VTDISSDLRSQREDVVRRHLVAEENNDVPAVLATFAPGRVSYWGDTLGGELNGEQAVGDMLTAGLTALSDLKIEVIHLHHAADAVVTELRLESTHTAEFDGIPATGRRISYHMCAVFRFDGSDLWQEAVYYDLAGIKAQLTA
jgi:C-1 hydroxylase